MNTQPKCAKKKYLTVQIWMHFFFAVFLCLLNYYISYNKNVGTKKNNAQKSKINKKLLTLLTWSMPVILPVNYLILDILALLIRWPCPRIGEDITKCEIFFCFKYSK